MSLFDEARKVARENSDFLMKIPGVHGIGVSRRGGKPVILIYVYEGASDAALEQIPDELGGFNIVVEESSEFRAY